MVFRFSLLIFFLPFLFSRPIPYRRYPHTHHPPPSELLHICPATSPHCSCVSDLNCSPPLVCTHLHGVNRCIRRPLLPHFNKWDALATFMVFICAGLVAGAGMGGGGLFVQIFLQTLDLATDEAIPLSQVTIFGGALANLVYNYPLKHPNDAKRPLIDYHALLVLQPSIFIGTMLGVFVQVMSPTWLILILIVLMMSFSGYVTGIKAKKTWDEETLAMQDRRIDEDNGEWLLTNGQNINEFDYIPASDSLESAYEQVKQDESNPRKSIYYLSILVLIVIVFTLIRGGHPKLPSIAGVSICTDAFWIWTVLQIVALVIYTIPFSIRQFEFFDIKTRMNVHNRVGELNWNKRNVIYYPILSVFMGFFGGMLGLGGAIFSNPMLISLGMLGPIVIATSSTAVLLSAISAVLNSAVMGILLVDYAVWYSFVGFIGTFAGIYFFQWLLKIYNRKSVLFIIITGVILSEALLLFFLGWIRFMHDLETGEHLRFVDFCDVMINKH